MSAILEERGHKSGGNCTNNLDRYVAKVNIQIRVATGSNEVKPVSQASIQTR
jgi:hypothetical protein